MKHGVALFLGQLKKSLWMMLMTHLLAPSGNVWLGSVTLTPSRASRRKMCPACAQCWFRSSRPHWFAEGKAQPTLQMQYLTLLREAVFAVIGLIMFKCFLLFFFVFGPNLTMYLEFDHCSVIACSSSVSSWCPNWEKTSRTVVSMLLLCIEIWLSNVPILKVCLNCTVV